jgi:hypothetical protein
LEVLTTLNHGPTVERQKIARRRRPGTAVPIYGLDMVSQVTLF